MLYSKFIVCLIHLTCLNLGLYSCESSVITDKKNASGGGETASDQGNAADENSGAISEKNTKKAPEGDSVDNTDASNNGSTVNTNPKPDLSIAEKTVL